MKLALFTLLISTPVAANELTINFADGAPKDRFTIASTGCDLAGFQVTVDLNGSQGDLIFDVTAKGAGVEVFQPVEVISGAATLSSIKDGDTTLGITVANLSEGAPLKITADLDDTIGQREITVTGSEISGAKAILTTADGQTVSGVFDEKANAKIPLTANCTV